MPTMKKTRRRQLIFLAIILLASSIIFFWFAFFGSDDQVERLELTLEYRSGDIQFLKVSHKLFGGYAAEFHAYARYCGAHIVRRGSLSSGDIGSFFADAELDRFLSEKCEIPAGSVPPTESCIRVHYQSKHSSYDGAGFARQNEKCWASTIRLMERVR